MYFPHDLPARYCLTFLMRCCLSLKVAFRFTLKALFTVYSFSLSWSICFLFLCSLIYIPPANRSWGYYTIALCSNSMVFRLAVEAAASLPSSSPPKREWNGHQSHLPFCCYYLCQFEIVSLRTRAHHIPVMFLLIKQELGIDR